MHHRKLLTKSLKSSRSISWGIVCFYLFRESYLGKAVKQVLNYIFCCFTWSSRGCNNMRKGIHGNMPKGQFFKGRGVSYAYLSESIRPKASGAGAGGQREELRPWQRSWGRRLGIRKGVIKPQETPCSWASNPKTRVCFMLSPTPLTLRGALPHNRFSRRRS